MEQNPGDSSDSELSDGWTIVDEGSSVQNVNTVNVEEKDSIEFTDAQTSEGVECKDHEVPKGEETDSDGISVISDSDEGDYVGVPFIDPCERKYIHHSSDHINVFLNLILAITLSAVIGLGVGHYLGTQEGLRIQDESINLLQLENNLLHQRLQELLKDRQLYGVSSAIKRDSSAGITFDEVDIPNAVCLNNKFAHHCTKDESSPNESMIASIKIPNLALRTTSNTLKMGMNSKKYSGIESNHVKVNDEVSPNSSERGKLIQGTSMRRNDHSLHTQTSTFADYVNMINVFQYTYIADDILQNENNGIQDYSEETSIDTAKASTTIESKKLSDEVNAAIGSHKTLSDEVNPAAIGSSRKLPNEENATAIGSSRKLSNEENATAIGSSKQLSDEVNAAIGSHKTQSDEVNAAAIGSSRKLSNEENATAIGSSRKLSDENPAAIGSSKQLSDEVNAAIGSHKTESDEVNAAAIGSSRKLSNEENPAAIGSSKKLSDEVSAAVSVGFEVSTKLKDIFSRLHSSFTDWNQRGSFNSPSYRDKINHFGKEAFKQMNHVFADGEKAQKLLSKIMEKLDTFRNTFPGVCQLYNMYSNDKKWCLDEHDNIVRIPGVKNPNKVYGPHLPNYYYKAKEFTNVSDKNKDTLKIKNNKKCFNNDRDTCQVDSNKSGKSDSTFYKNRNKKGHEKRTNPKNVKSTYPEKVRGKPPKRVVKPHDRFQSDRGKVKHTSDMFREQELRKQHKSHTEQKSHPGRNWNEKLNYEDRKKSKKVKENSHSSKSFQKHDYSVDAWTMDDAGHKLHNISGDWLIKRHLARAKHRENARKSDWFFERAGSREVKRNEHKDNSRWYFMRGRSREHCRLKPNSDLCQTSDYQSRYQDKFYQEYAWKKNHEHKHDDDDVYEQASKSQRDWRVRHTPKHWSPKKFISEAFLAAAKFLKA